jgi:hypothetical protein
MAKDTLTKLRALISMKSTLIATFQADLILAQDLVEALRSDLEHAVSLIQRKDEQIKRLQDENYRLLMKGWEQQDKDEEWLANYLAEYSPIEEDIMAQPADSTLHARHINHPRINRDPMNDPVKMLEDDDDDPDGDGLYWDERP